MRDTPILMNGPMVRAVLEGRKTVTRRIVKPQPTLQTTHWNPDNGSGPAWIGTGPSEATGGTRQTWGWKDCPFGRVGDRLWVRETHFDATNLNERRVLYRASYDRSRFGWTPSIHMQRTASRITLEVTGVRVERLQDITHEQAIVEGVHQIDIGSGYPMHYSSTPLSWSEVVEGGEDAHDDARYAFRDLWQNINGAGSWDANPWVWVIEFKRIEQERNAA